MSEILPFLATLTPTGTRPFTSALPKVDVPSGPSPWAPPPAPPAVEEPDEPPIDLAALRDEAIEQGRAEGLRETAALRAKLDRLVTALATAEKETSALRANLIAEAAATVVDAWLGATGSIEKFLPVLRAWEARSADPAKAHVHPTEVEEIRAALGESTIEVVADPAVSAGSVQLRGAAHELTHDWSRRLGELREAIVHALEVKS